MEAVGEFIVIKDHIENDNDNRGKNENGVFLNYWGIFAEVWLQYPIKIQFRNPYYFQR